MDVAQARAVYADLVSVLGRTGIRRGEAWAMLVRDFIEVPVPMLHVVRNQAEGTAADKTPSPAGGPARAVAGRAGTSDPALHRGQDP